MPENNLLDILKRITAAKQTRKITSTMELIASTRLHRARTLLSNYKDWAKHMRDAAQCLPDSCFSPLTGSNEENNKVYIVFGGSKGLSGSYGPNLLQYAAPVTEGHMVIAVGSGTGAFFSDAHSFFGDETPSAKGSRAIAQTAKALCKDKVVNEVYLIYMRGTKLITERLYPLVPMKGNNDMVIAEPSKKVLFPVLFEEYIESVIYEAHLHTFVAEQIARVSAMDNATQNADDIIDELQYTYNRIRQSAITQEIIMVSNAARGGEA